MSNQNLVRACASARRQSAALSTAIVLALAGTLCTSAGAAAPETPGETFPASVTPAGEWANGEGIGEYTPVSISADGRYVAFQSASTNLGEAGPAGAAEGFVKDLSSGALALVTRADGVSGAPAGEPGIEDLRLSADGRYVIFTSAATNLGATLPGEDPSEQHVYRRDLQSGETILVDRTSGAEGAILSRGARAEGISANGRYILFAADVANLEDPAGDHAETAIATQYVRDTVTGTTTAISRASGVAGDLANEASEATSISPDGRYVAFATTASNLPGFTGQAQVYLRDLQSATTTLISQNGLGAPGDRGSGLPAIVGGQGCEIEFSSLAFNLLEPDPTPVSGEQLYIADFCSGPTTLTLISETEGQQAGLAYGSWGTSADGNLVLFGGSFSLSGVFHLFVKNRTSGEVSQIDRASGGAGAPANDEPQQAAISENGCRVVFGDRATNLYGAGPPEGPGGEKPFEAYVRQLAPCTGSGKGSDAGTQPLTGRSSNLPGSAASASAAKLAIAGLDRRKLMLSLSGPGWVSVRVRRLIESPHRRWRFLRTLGANAGEAGRIEIPLPHLSPGEYRLNVRLHRPGSAGIVRLLRIGPPA
jgi:WD40 repeat protein